MTNVSDAAVIREMDASELIEYYERLDREKPDGYAVLINEIMRQYYQLTGSYDY